LGNFSIAGIEPEVLSGKLMGEYQIHAVAIKWENISGVRITPHVYTLTRDLDRLVEAVTALSKT
jgi:selenocysteine lyase/cysteine desulfurase